MDMNLRRIDLPGIVPYVQVAEERSSATDLLEIDLKPPFVASYDLIV
jgi:hypothetical protein